jgi:hypothetical protein
MFPELTEEEVNAVGHAVREFYAQCWKGEPARSVSIHQAAE